MQIRTLFLLCMAALTALAIGLGGWILTMAFSDYHVAGQVAAAFEVNDLLFDVADTIAAEEPVVGKGQLQDLSGRGSARMKLEAIRQGADHAIDQAERRIATLSYRGVPRQLDIIRTIRQGLPALRGLADSLLARPKDELEPTAFGRYLTALNTMLDTLDFALDLSGMATTRSDEVTMDLVLMARLTSTVGRLNGLRSAPLIMAIDLGAALTPAQLEQRAEFNGATRAAWTLIDALSRRLASVPGMATTVEVTYGVFKNHDELCKAVVMASRSGGPYPVSFETLGKNTIRTAMAIRDMRSFTVLAARDRIAASRRAATIGVATAAAAVLVITAVSLWVLAILQRRIVTPVLALTEVIGCLARRDYGSVLPATRHGDEIGRMATAIEALRRAGMAAEKSEARIVHMARHDALTGLPNRVLLHERMEQAMTLVGRGHTCAALCLDLDRFKAVNDMFGHPVGDRLLQAVAERLSACIRETDTASRVGGDEFAVLLVGLEQPDAAGLLAQRIIQALGQPFDLDGQIVIVGASVGIAIAPQDATSGMTLLKNADIALYRAKSEERGTYCYFEAEMDARLQARMTLERDLREAVRTEGFEVFYQPQYNLAADTLSGFEALVRWRHPTRGLVTPAEFIPLAEETGLVAQIGGWVLRQACHEATHWPDTVRLAVNLSAVQFKNPLLVQTVQEALAASGLPATRLELEITESVLLNNNTNILAMLHQLRDMGVSISMDDFGTGYSSLSYLRSFPFNKIKIDQSFIRDVSRHEDSKAIVRAVVALGNSLGMKTTAEGVETPDQLAQLRLEGCTEVQGYLFSKPASAAAARLLANGNITTAAAVA